MAAYAEAGGRVETYAIPTGGGLAPGRWHIQEAMDVRNATLDLLEPVQRRVLDYRENPWHVVQWTTGTPEQGIICDLVTLDSQEELTRLAPGALAGKMVLTGMEIRKNRVLFCEKGALGIISDAGVKDCPDAVAWGKFGWGGLELQHAAARLIGLVVSANHGKILRELLALHKKLKVKVQVDVRRYTGSLDVVSGIIPGPHATIRRAKSGRSLITTSRARCTLPLASRYASRSSACSIL